MSTESRTFNVFLMEHSLGLSRTSSYVSNGLSTRSLLALFSRKTRLKIWSKPYVHVHSGLSYEYLHLFVNNQFSDTAAGGELKEDFEVVL